MDKPFYSDNGELLASQGLLSTKQDYFFSYAKQKEHTFEIAKELFLNGMETDEAIHEAKTFVQACYDHIFKYQK